RRGLDPLGLRETREVEIEPLVRVDVDDRGVVELVLGVDRPVPEMDMAVQMPARLPALDEPVHGLKPTVGLVLPVANIPGWRMGHEYIERPAVPDAVPEQLRGHAEHVPFHLEFGELHRVAIGVARRSGQPGDDDACDRIANDLEADVGTPFRMTGDAPFADAGELLGMI